jgi:hypothetical protein
MAPVDMKALMAEERERRRKKKLELGANLESKATAPLASSSSPSNAAAATAPPPPPPCKLAPRAPLHLPDHEIATQLGVRGLHYVPDFITPVGPDARCASPCQNSSQSRPPDATPRMARRAPPHTAWVLWVRGGGTSDEPPDSLATPPNRPLVLLESLSRDGWYQRVSS